VCVRAAKKIVAAHSLLILYPKNIFTFIRPVHVHLKTDKVDFKKKATVKNVVECQKDFFAYFNVLETRGAILDTIFIEFFNNFRIKPWVN
jgi:hypothetical protein